MAWQTSGTSTCPWIPSEINLGVSTSSSIRWHIDRYEEAGLDTSPASSTSSVTPSSFNSTQGWLFP